MGLWEQLIANGLIIGVTYALLALGLTLIFGILGIINFANGEFYMLGAFGSFIFQKQLHLNYIMAGVLTICVISLLAFVIERFTLRPLIQTDHLNSLLATFALSIIILNFVQMIYGATPRQINTPFNGVIQIGNVYLTQQKIFVVVLGLIVIFLLNFFMKYSKLGKLMRAVSQNQLGAMVSGIPIKRIYSVSFIIGIALAGFAGFLIGPTTYVTPTMGTSAMLVGFVIVILGGLGSIPGAIIGGLILGIVETACTGIIGNEWKDMIGYIILILVLLIRPQGLFGFKRRSQ